MIAGSADQMIDVAAEVVATIAKRVRPARTSLDLDQSLDELGIDSLQVVEMIFDLEEKFDIEIPFNANSSASAFGTVGDIVAAIRGLVAEKSIA
jgi:acyl carrier protein